MTIPHFPVEIIQYILKQLAQNIHPQATSSLDSPIAHPISDRGPAFDTRTYPYTDPESRACLATSCARVSKMFYDLSTPLIWEYINVHNGFQLETLVFAAQALPSQDVSREGSANVPWGHYIRRIDFVLAASDHATFVKRLLKVAPHVKSLSFWHPSTFLICNPRGRFRQGIMPFIAMHCRHIEELNFLSTIERPTLRELSLISLTCDSLKTLQVFEVDTTPTAFLDYVGGRDKHFSLFKGVPVGDIHPFPAVQQQPHTQLTFSFPSLKSLIVGCADVKRSMTEKSNGESLLKHLVMQKVALPAFKRLEYRLSMQGMEEILLPFQDQMSSAIFHVGDAHKQGSLDIRFKNIRRLTIIVYGGKVLLPSPGSPLIQSIHILPARPNRGLRYTEHPPIHKQIHMALECLLQQLEKQVYPNLRLVVLWTTAVYDADYIRTLYDVFSVRLGEKGVNLRLQEVALWRFDEDESTGINTLLRNNVRNAPIRPILMETRPSSAAGVCFFFASCHHDAALLAVNSPSSKLFSRSTMSSPLNLSNSPIFKYYPWFTDLPVGDYEGARAKFDRNDSRDDAAFVLMDALEMFERDFATVPVVSNVARTKRDRMIVADLFHDEQRVNKARTPTNGKMEATITRPIYVMLTGWKVLEKLYMVKRFKPPLKGGKHPEMGPLWGEIWSNPDICPLQFWKMDDIAKTAQDCVSGLQAMIKDLDNSPPEQTSDTGKLAWAYVEGRKKHLVEAVIENVQVAALMLRLMVVHGIVDPDCVDEEQWAKVYGDMFGELDKEKKLWITTKLAGPLHGAALINPMFLLNTVAVAHSSPCPEEFMKTGKAMGSSNNVEDLNELSCEIFSLVLGVAVLKQPMSAVPRELLSILDDKQTKGVLENHRFFYQPSGVTVKKVDSSSKAAIERVYIVRIKDMVVSPSLFQRNKEITFVDYIPKKAKSGSKKAEEASIRKREQERALTAARLRRQRLAELKRRRDEAAARVEVLQKARLLLREDEDGIGNEDPEDDNEDSHGDGGGEVDELWDDDDNAGVGRYGSRGEVFEDGGTDVNPNPGLYDDLAPVPDAMDIDEPLAKKTGLLKIKINPLSLANAQPSIVPSTADHASKERTQKAMYDRMKRECLPSVANTAFAWRSIPQPISISTTHNLAEGGKNINPLHGNLVSLLDATGLRRGRVAVFLSPHYKEFWDNMVAMFGVEYCPPVGHLITSSEQLWLERVNMGRTSIIGSKCWIMQTAQATSSQTLTPEDRFLARLNQSVDMLFSDFGVESLRMGVAMDLVVNARLPMDQRKPLLMEKTPCFGVRCVTMRPENVEECVWSETMDGAYLESRLFPIGSFLWYRAGSKYAFYSWEMAPWGLPQWIQVMEGELVTFVAKCPNKTPFDPVTNIAPLTVPPADFTVLAVRLASSTMMIIPPGALHSSFVVGNTVWMGGYFVDWSNILSSLSGACRFLLSGQFTASTKTTDFCETIVRFMLLFHHRYVIQGRQPEVTPYYYPNLKKDEDWVNLAGLFCWVTLGNVLMPESYVPEREGKMDDLLKVDANAVPQYLRHALAYARGLVEISLDCIHGARNPTRSFRQDVYLPMLVSTVRYLEDQFDSLHGEKTDGILKAGFWSLSARKERFRLQLFMAKKRCEEAAPAFSDLYRQHGPTTNWSVVSGGYKISAQPATSIDFKETLARGMTRLDTLFLWVRSGRDNENSHSDATEGSPGFDEMDVD
ncbi:hypothetical protein NMY22_g7177 [Coprinellus aureogranulatus]|nr:hypothetical protein NMY22_g7177 [Coprinellus aureogranulatus]